MGKTFLALFAVLSLLLSAFAIARPVIANHDVEGPAVQPTLVEASDAFPGGNVPCPEGTEELKIEPAVSGTYTHTFQDGSTATVTVTVSGNTITEFIIDGALAMTVHVKATNASNVYDYRPDGVAHDDGLVSPATDSISHISFCLVPIAFGSLLIAKVDGENQPLGGAGFTVDGVEYLDEDGDGFVCIDGLLLGETYNVSETTVPENYEGDADRMVEVTVADDCATRTAGADTTFTNERIEEDFGSITIVKEFEDECPVCPTRTPGYWFNRGGGGGVADADVLLGQIATTNPELVTFPIGEGGSTTFDSVAKVHAYLDWDRAGGDGAMGLSGTAQLLRHYLALLLNVNFFDCPADEVTFEGQTIQSWLDQAWAVLSQGGEDEAIKDALDAINNANLGDGTLECPENGTGGSAIGFKFELLLDGVVIDEETITEGNSVTFSGLTPGETYQIREISPEGLECVIVSAMLGDTPLEVVDGLITVTIPEEGDLDLTITVVNECEEVEEELGSVLVAKVDEAGALLGGATFTIDGTPHADTDEDGFVCLDGLTLGAMVTIAETIAPDGYVGDPEPQTVQVTSTMDCEDRLDGATVADADAVFVNVLEEDLGRLELIKWFCPTEGTDLIFWVLLTEEPVDGFRVQGEDEMPSTDGCTLGAPSEEALGAWFEIDGENLEEPIVVQTVWNQILHLDLEPGSYTVTELGTTLSAEIEIVANGDTAVTVFNFLGEEEGEGRLKILKFNCDNEGETAFVIVEEDAGLSDLSDLPGNCVAPEPGDATFTLTRGSLTSAEFTLGSDGARLIPLTAATYTLNEVSPNVASSAAFPVNEGETTTVIVFNFTGGGEGPGEEETPRGGQLPGQGGPRQGTLPDTATAPSPTGSIPAALLALAMLTGLGAAGYAMQAEARRRR